MKKTIAILIAVVISVGNMFAQTASWKKSRHSVYLGGGFNWFIGDLTVWTVALRPYRLSL